MAQAQPTAPPRRGLTLTQQIFIGLGARHRGRWLVRRTTRPGPIYFRPFSQLFLRLIKMIIAPLIFATLVAGIAGAGHFKVVGRMGLRAIIYFEVVTTLALVIGCVAVNVMRPGVGVQPADGAAVRDHRRRAQTWDQILLHVVPESVIEAMADGDVLQIVVFSMIFAIALGMIGEKGRPVVSLVRGAGRDDVQVHEHRHAVRADRRRRGDRLHRRPRRHWRPLQPRLAGRARCTSRWPSSSSACSCRSRSSSRCRSASSSRR